MMQTLINDDKYEILFKKNIFKGLRSGLKWFFFIPFIMIVIIPWIYPEITDKMHLFTAILGFLVNYGVIGLLYLIIRIMEKRNIYNREPLDAYLYFNREGLKVPIYEERTTGRRQHRRIRWLHYMLLLDEEYVSVYHLYEIAQLKWKRRKHKITFFLGGNCELKLTGEKTTFLVLPEIYEKLKEYLKENDFKLDNL